MNREAGDGATRRTDARPLTVAPRDVFATLVLFLVVAVCVRLGFWQLDRRTQRQSFNAVLVARSLEQPVVDPVRLRDTTGIIYRPAVLNGRFDHDRSVVLPGRSYGGAPGVHLLTPFHLDGSAAAILVNRGWVPAADGASIDFAHFAADTTRRVEGVLLAFPDITDSRGAAGSGAGIDPDTFRRVWYRVDAFSLRRQFPYALVDAQLQVTSNVAASNAPIALPPPSLDEGPHLGYAIQWFSFALIGVAGWIALVVRGRKDKRPVG
jgi:surfeit locus 1 family protein